jgi:hypothetical protein
MMNKNIFRAITILSAVVVVFIAVGRLIKASEQLNPQLPKKLYSVSSLRFQAYTSAFEGQQCTVQGTCIEKKWMKEILIYFSGIVITHNPFH